jgi:hypothetical protein
MNALLRERRVGVEHSAKSGHQAESGSVRLPVHNFVNAYSTLVRAIVSRRGAEFILGDGVFRKLERTRITAIKKFVRREFDQL